MTQYLKKISILLAFFGIVLTFTGCGSRDDFVITGNNNIPVGAVQVTSVLARTVPSQITDLRFTGLDANNNVAYGPLTRSKSQTILLESVPTSVTQLQIEYLAGNILVGRGVTPVSIASGQTVTVNDPDFDIVFANAPLQISPSSSTILVNTTQTFTVQATVTGGGTSDVSSLVAWSTDNAGVASINNQGVASGQSVGTTNVTANLTFGTFSVSGTTPLTVAPVLSSLEVFPPNSFGTTGGGVQYRALGRFSDGSTQVLTDQVNWSVTNQGSAGASTDITISSAGLTSIPSAASGSQKATITAEMNGINNTATLTLNEFLYVVSVSSGPDLSMFSIDPDNGSVTPLSPPSVNSGPQPEAAIYSPDGRLIYVPYPFDESFSMFTVGDDGVAVANIDPGTGTNVVPVDNGFTGSPTILAAGVVDPLNRFLYIVDSNVGQINTFSIAANGLVTPLRKTPVSGQGNADARDLIISHDGRFMFVRTRSDKVESYAILDDGDLQKISTVTTSSDQDDFALTPDGTRLYVSDDGDDLIFAYSVSSAGVLSPIINPARGNNTTQTPSDEARDIVCTNDRLYVRIRGVGNIAMYRIEADGNLSEIIDPGSGTNVVSGIMTGMAIDNLGRFLYTAEANSDRLTRFEITPEGLLVNPVNTTVEGAIEVLISP